MVLCACAATIPRAPTLEDGRRYYRESCASCHGVHGYGDGPAAASLKVPPTDLTTLRQRHGGSFRREFVIEVITGERQIGAHGSREMPIWSQRFGPHTGATAVAAIAARRRLEALASYIETIQRPGRGG
jgi:mono/diheme cytochrome c family protein